MTPREPDVEEPVLCEACGEPLSSTITRRRKRCRRHADAEVPSEEACPQPEEGFDYAIIYQHVLRFAVTGHGVTKFWGTRDGTPVEEESLNAIRRDAVLEGKFEVQDHFITDVTRMPDAALATPDGSQAWDAEEWVRDQDWEPVRGVVRPGERPQPEEQETLPGVEP